MTFLKSLVEGIRDFINPEYTDYYTVQKNPSDGKWYIYDADGFGVRGYNRRRDAYRGAERAGLTLI